MTAQDRLAMLAQQGQDALVNAIRTWAEAVQQLSSGLGAPGFGASGFGVPGSGAPGLGATGLTLPDLTAAVDQTFDLAEQVLAAQRELTKAVLRAATASAGGTGRADWTG